MSIDYTDPAASERYQALVNAGVDPETAEKQAFSTKEQTPERSRKYVPPFKPFPTEILPVTVARFIVECAEAMGCDESFVALPLLTALGASIGTTRRITLKRGWAEYPILWAATVAHSGAKKSPPFDAALAPLHALQADAYRQWQGENERFEAESLEHERAIAEYKKKGGEPPAPLTPPKLNHILTQESTTEAVGAMLAETPRGLLLARDELSGWLSGFNQYKNGKGGDVPAWLEMHRGGTVKIDRRNAPSLFIARAAVWVCGTIQPGTLRRCLTPEFTESGFAARLLLAYPPPRASRWTDKTVSAGAEHDIERLMFRLRTLGMGIGESTNIEQPIDLSPIADAQKLFARFVDEHGEEQLAIEDDRLRATYAKLEGVAARFALIDHLSQDITDPFADESAAVGVNSVEVGITLARWFANEAARIYAMLSEDGEDQVQRELIELIQRMGGKVSVRELAKKRCRYRQNPKAAEQDLQLLVNSGMGKWVYTSTGGRQSHTFILTTTTTIGIGESPDIDSANGTYADADAGDQRFAGGVE